VNICWQCDAVVPDAGLEVGNFGILLFQSRQPSVFSHLVKLDSHLSLFSRSVRA